MRIDHKSGRDVVTEVDYATEKLVLEAIRERYPDDAILAEESGHHRRRTGRTARTGAPGSSTRSTDGQLRQRDPVLLRQHRAGEDGTGVGVILDPLRDDCTPRPRTARPRSTASRCGPPQGGAERLRGQPGGHRARWARPRAADRTAIRIRGAWGAPRWRWPTSPTGVSSVRPERRAVAVGRGRGRADRRAGGATVSDLHGGPWWDRSAAARRQHRRRPAPAPRRPARAAGRAAARRSEAPAASRAVAACVHHGGERGQGPGGRAPDSWPSTR